MGLADFISNNLDRLTDEWLEFAYTCLPAAHFVGERALRNGSRELLLAIVSDMESVQTGAEQKAKSRGERDDHDSADEIISIAREHAEQRLRDGFTLAQLVAEYRALRATVIRCWSDEWSKAEREQIDELIRFNEAMDQSLTEAVDWFNQSIEQARDIFVAMLGHDLRDPLSAAVTAVHLQQQVGYSNDIQMRAAEIASRSLQRISGTIDNLLDFARTRLSGPLQIVRKPGNVRSVCEDIREKFALANPDREIAVNCDGDLDGEWDLPRIAQLVTNLVSNAAKYGAANEPITLGIRGDGDVVTVTVHNTGTPIPLAEQHTVFDPLVRGVSDPDARSRTRGMGLGLYIVRMIAEAHGGKVELESNEQRGTTFTVSLPKMKPS